MRIHLNLSAADTYAALNAARHAADVHFERYDNHGSRSHERAVDVILSGDAPHRINSRQYDAPNAASWDQWGIFLANIYAADPTAKSWAYADADDFHGKTGDRFNPDNERAVTSTSSPGYQRTSHKWNRIELVTGRVIWRCNNAKHGDCTAVLGR